MSSGMMFSAEVYGQRQSLKCLAHILDLRLAHEFRDGFLCREFSCLSCIQICIFIFTLILSNAMPSVSQAWMLMSYYYLAPADSNF